jgi:hypothetical protein
MKIDWSKHKYEKKQIKIKYLEFLKKYYKSREVNLRDEITDWALRQYPTLNIPKKQFGGTFDHSKNGFFVKDHNFSVTAKTIEKDATKAGISESDYIDELISIVKEDRRK